MSETLRVLIVDDDRQMAKTLTDIFRVKGYRAEAAHSGSEALEKVKAAETEAEGRFGCVLTDIKMPEMSGVELHRAVKAIDPDLPVVFMTAYAADETVKEGLAEGGVALLAKPLDINLMLNFFLTLSKESVIVIIDDDANFCKILHDILKARGFHVIEIADPANVMQTLVPDGQVVLLDMKLRELSGLDVLREIRRRHPRQPVILVTGYRQEMAEAIQVCLDIGAYTCLYKPFEIEELLTVLAEIRHGELASALSRRVKKPGEKG
ncbi:response regulator [Planctomycetota bacterium]